MDDGRLIQQYAQHGSQEAFAEIVRRYMDMVYWTCWRELRDAPLAEEATQAVFLLLARKASSLRGHVLLSGWLFQTALYAAKNARRQETRRRQREQLVMQDVVSLSTEGSQAWEAVEPLLNDALSALSPAEQDLLTQRFWQGRSLADIGGALGIREDAARMRVNRALEKLRRWFAAHDIALTATGLQAALPQAVSPAPAHLAAALVRLASLSMLASGPDTLAHHLAQKVGLSMLRKQLTRQAAAALALAALTAGGVDAVCVVSQNHVVRPVVQPQTQLAQSQPPSEQAQALADLNQMYATYQAMHTFRCDTHAREEPDGLAQEATYEMERPYKVHFQQAILLGANTSQQSLVVSDGQIVYAAGTAGMTPTKYATFPIRTGFDPRSGFAVMEDMTNWGLLPNADMPFILMDFPISEMHDPQQILALQYSLGAPVTLDLDGYAMPKLLDVVIIKIPYRPGTPGRSWAGAAQILTYYIGHMNHLLYKLTVQDPISPTQWSTRTEYINDMEINKPIPATDFTFSPPPGSQEVSNASDIMPNP